VYAGEAQNKIRAEVEVDVRDLGVPDLKMKVTLNDDSVPVYNVEGLGPAAVVQISNAKELTPYPVSITLEGSRAMDWRKVGQNVKITCDRGG
jgi:hypothetical protein